MATTLPSKSARDRLLKDLANRLRMGTEQIQSFDAEQGAAPTDNVDEKAKL
jgi:hypothetical protein